jgi:hypothetical protein
MGDTLFTFAHFIINALEGLLRSRFIKTILDSMPKYLNKYTKRQAKYIWENDRRLNRKDYIKILKDKNEESVILGNNKERDKEDLAKASPIEDKMDAEE